MSELHEAAQDLVDYYEGLAKKYGRIAEYKAVKTRMDRVKKALAATPWGTAAVMLEMKSKEADRLRAQQAAIRAEIVHLMEGTLTGDIKGDILLDRIDHIVATKESADVSDG
jgi:hypothetical protein